ncbi:alcohol dehydrogenase catalytic domain-containing protein [Spirilliplanes yamanashiensis]|uniref:Alcohol dehydrogenase n=1 Tax=Spirilliplanes yamanashiensis TaxID=42233 RepID=A0A8J3Y3U0_9ACTN|nr:zinc-binding dehydrogenase [Spirilliplanes yamanashiensis]MDP9814073.1 S-(hydroxymethyl)glutathione dehydrogenase/alcohol dehydrogenase [Spirilliplanes yamanashiensis]GIJ00947.1 alcohol dehydrogenase [Spirilliplanes yamanashiensis]
MTRAVVATGRGAVSVTEVDLPPVGDGQVRVRVRAAGVCHSDLSMLDGTVRVPYPLVLGHEAAGEVVEAGPGVPAARVGEHVVLNWAPACRACWFCTHGEPWLCAATAAPAVPRGDGPPVALGLGALAEEVVVPAAAAVAVPPELPWEQAALLGCAVLTGTGAVRTTAAVAPGQSVLVIGLGGVGLAAVAAARAAGAGPVIAADVAPGKRDLALAAGATEFVVSDDTLSRTVRALTEGRGADHAFECVGRSATIRAAWRATRRGGTVTVVGMGAKDDMVELGALEIFHSARTLRSSVYGSSDPDRDVPLLAAEVLSGALDLRFLVTGRIGLDGVPAAFERMSRGEGARSVVLF